MEILSSPISRQELADRYCSFFESMCKAVVDIERKLCAVDAELHADLESLLLENGSLQENLWGVNLYPLQQKNDFIEYTSLINIRPHQDNPSMEILSDETREKVRVVVESLVLYEPETP